MIVLVEPPVASAHHYVLGRSQMAGDLVLVRVGGQISLAVRDADLSNAQLRELASRHMPAQSWYEEDMEGLY